MAAAIDRLQHSKQLLLQAAGMQQQQLDMAGHSQMQEQEGSRAGAAAARAAGDPAEAQQTFGDPAAAGDSNNQQQQLTSELACRLGAVCGSQADCWKRLGQADSAQQLYAESITYLEPFADQDPEVWHALCVSINKSGDLHFLQQQWQEAKGLYEKALRMRLGVWQKLELKQQTRGRNGDERQEEGSIGQQQQQVQQEARQQEAVDPQQQAQQLGREDGEVAAASSLSAGLDVVASHIKVADVCMVRMCGLGLGMGSTNSLTLLGLMPSPMLLCRMITCRGRHTSVLLTMGGSIGAGMLRGYTMEGSCGPCCTVRGLCVDDFLCYRQEASAAALILACVELAFDTELHKSGSSCAAGAAWPGSCAMIYPVCIVASCRQWVRLKLLKSQWQLPLCCCSSCTKGVREQADWEDDGSSCS